MKILENKTNNGFFTRYSYLKYQIMLFGFSNTPANFEGYINKILAKKLNIFIVSIFKQYVDLY